MFKQMRSRLPPPAITSSPSPTQNLLLTTPPLKDPPSPSPPQSTSSPTSTPSPPPTNPPPTPPSVSKSPSIYHPFPRSLSSAKRVSAVSAPNTCNFVHCTDRKEGCWLPNLPRRHRIHRHAIPRAAARPDRADRLPRAPERKDGPVHA